MNAADNNNDAVMTFDEFKRTMQNLVKVGNGYGAMAWLLWEGAAMLGRGCERRERLRSHS